MPYNPKQWADLESGATPVVAAELNRIEQGIADAHDAIENDMLTRLTALAVPVGPWYRINITAPLATIGMLGPGTAQNSMGLPMLEACEVVGLAIRASAGVSAGNITVRVAKNDVPHAGRDLVLSVANPRTEVVAIPGGELVFAPEDNLSFDATASADLLPAGTNDVAAWAFLRPL